MVDATCCLCNEKTETHGHLFFRRRYASDVIRRLLEVVDFPMTPGDLMVWTNLFVDARSHKNLLFQMGAYVVSIVVYCIWHSRDLRKHSNVVMSVESC